MPRSALFHQIKRRLSQHRRARTQEITLEEWRERLAKATPEEQPPDRRRRALLLGAGALGASSMLRPVRALARSEPRIAIIGAGIAGLTCALELADRGISVTVYEASHRAGGRMFTNRANYWSEQQISEWGGEFIDTGHRTIRRLARRFGLALDDVNAAVPDGATDTFYFDGDYYLTAQADRDFSVIYRAVQADLDSAPFPTTFDSFTPAALALDRMSVKDWIRMRVPGGLSSKLGQLLDVAYTIEYAADSADQSALNILYLLGFQPDQSGRTLALFGESDERFHIRGGNEQLPRAIARSLGEGCIRYGHRLMRMARSAGARYALDFHTAGGTRSMDADVVILALPFAVMDDIDLTRAGFDALKQRAIRELGRGVSSKLQLQFRSRLWNRPGPWGVSTGSSDVDTGYQEGWDVTRAQRGASGIMNFFGGGTAVGDLFGRTAFATASNQPVVQDARRVLAQAEPVFPGIAREWEGRATLSLWHFHPFTRLSYSFYRPGQYTTFGGYEKARQGRVFFCGEHTSTDFQGYMEGGAAEGLRAARDVAKMLNY